MKQTYLQFMCCPTCGGDLAISDIREEMADKVKSGTLSCLQCNERFGIKNFIPRFQTTTHYADSFGSQWKTFAKAQLDTSDRKESQLRFQSELGWTEKHLNGKNIIEFGSGAGRFLDVASNAKVNLAVGIDATDAVDASQENLGDRDNVFFVQADIFNLPIKIETFDFVYSIGVLHHTPDPEQGFEVMVNTAAENGRIGLSLYDISQYYRPNKNTIKVAAIDFLWSLNLLRAELFRSVTTKLPSDLFLFYCKFWIPVLHYLNKIPILRYIRYLFPSTCYRNLPVEWSMLDTFDTYATRIVHQYRGKDLFQWFLSRGLQDIILMNGRAGWTSITAKKGSLRERESRKLKLLQPKGPGFTGELV